MATLVNRFIYSVYRKYNRVTMQLEWILAQKCTNLKFNKIANTLFLISMKLFNFSPLNEPQTCYLFRM